MKKVLAVIMFYVVSFSAIFIIYSISEPSSATTIKIAEYINFKHGVFGYFVLGFWITLLGLLILLAEFSTGKMLKELFKNK